jgi:hypothetical protein
VTRTGSLVAAAGWQRGQDDLHQLCEGAGRPADQGVGGQLDVEAGKQLAPTDGSVEQAGGTRRGPISPEDHNGGDACIGYLEFNEEFLAANAAPAAGDVLLVCRMVVPAGGWLATKRPCGPHPVEQRRPDPPPNR